MFLEGDVLFYPNASQKDLALEVLLSMCILGMCILGKYLVGFLH